MNLDEVSSSSRIGESKIPLHDIRVSRSLGVLNTRSYHVLLSLLHLSYCVNIMNRRVLQKPNRTWELHWIEPILNWIVLQLVLDCNYHMTRVEGGEKLVEGLCNFLFGSDQLHQLVSVWYTDFIYVLQINWQTKPFKIVI
jgi:hypothetical protein